MLKRSKNKHFFEPQRIFKGNYKLPFFKLKGWGSSLFGVKSFIFGRDVVLAHSSVGLNKHPHPPFSAINNELVFYRSVNSLAFFKKFVLFFSAQPWYYRIFWRLAKLLHLITILVICGVVVFLLFFINYFLIAGHLSDSPAVDFFFLWSPEGFASLDAQCYEWGRALTTLMLEEQRIPDFYVALLDPILPWLTVFFYTWQVYFQTHDVFPSGDGLFSHGPGLSVLVACYAACCAVVFKFFWVGHFKRADPWPFLLNYFLRANFLSLLYSTKTLEQVMGSNVKPFLSSSFALLDDKIVSTNTRQAMYDFNANIGFAGYVGFIDYFPSYDSFFNFSSFKKTRIRAQRFLNIDAIWKFLNRRNKLKVRVKNISLWPFTPVRDNYFEAAARYWHQPFLKKNLYSSLKFLIPLQENVWLPFLALFFTAISFFGDKFIDREREKIYEILTSFGNPDTFLIEGTAAVKDPTIPAQNTINSRVELYRRELNIVLAARLINRKVKHKSYKLFKFGWHNLINEYTFWSSTGINWDNLNFHKYYGDDRHDELAEGSDVYFFEQAGDLSAARAFYNEANFEIEEGPIVFEDTEEEEEELRIFDEDDLLEDKFFEDGFLHDEVYEYIPYDYEGEGEEEDYEVMYMEGVYKEGYTEEDEELISLLMSRPLAFGANQEGDYLGNGLLADIGLTKLEDDSSAYEGAEEWASFYTDICDLYWLNSYSINYQNFFEYPAAKFLTFPSSTRKSFSYLNRVRLAKSSEFLIYNARHYAHLLLPRFSYSWFSFIETFLSGLIYLAVGVFLLVILEFWMVGSFIVLLIYACALFLLGLLLFMFLLYISYGPSLFVKMAVAGRFWFFFIFNGFLTIRRDYFTFNHQSIEAVQSPRSTVYPVRYNYKWQLSFSRKLADSSNLSAVPVTSTLLARAELIDLEKAAWYASTFLRIGAQTPFVDFFFEEPKGRFYFNSRFFPGAKPFLVLPSVELFGCMVHKTSLNQNIGLTPACLVFTENIGYSGTYETRFLGSGGLPLISALVLYEESKFIIKANAFHLARKNSYYAFLKTTRNKQSNVCIPANLLYAASPRQFNLFSNPANSSVSNWLTTPDTAFSKARRVSAAEEVNNKRWTRSFYKLFNKKANFFSDQVHEDNTFAKREVAYANFLRLMFSSSYNSVVYRHRFAKKWGADPFFDHSKK